MPASHIRYRVVAATTLMSVLLYVDRFCISFAEVFIKEDLGLTDTQVGWMLSAFFWTYALGQVPCGWLADRFGARVMLTIYILSWSLFTGLTGAVGAFSLVAFATDMGTGSVWAFMQDVGGRYVGSVLGWGNMWGNLGAAVTPPLLIWIVSNSAEWELPSMLAWMIGEGINRNWNLAFLTCAAAFLIAGIAALGMNASVPIVPEEESETRPA